MKKILIIALSLLMSGQIFGNKIMDIISDRETYKDDCNKQLLTLEKVISEYKDQKQLLKDINEADKNGSTPLLLAINGSGCIEVIKYLLNNGAISTINTRNNRGISPLDAILFRNQLPNEWELFKLLLTKGASIKKMEKNGATVLDNKLLDNALELEQYKKPIRENRFKIIKLLLFLGLKPSEFDVQENVYRIYHPEEQISESESDKLFNINYELVELIRNPKKIKDYCTEEELKEFKEIEEACAKAFKNEPQTFDIMIKY